MGAHKNKPFVGRREIIRLLGSMVAVISVSSNNQVNER